MTNETIRSAPRDLDALVDVTGRPNAHRLANDGDAETCEDRRRRRTGQPERERCACEAERDSETSKNRPGHHEFLLAPGARRSARGKKLALGVGREPLTGGCNRRSIASSTSSSSIDPRHQSLAAYRHRRS